MSVRRVLVTGSSRGIGKAVALQLASAGFAVTVHCRQQRDEAEQVAQQVASLSDQSARVLQFDVCERDTVRAVLEADIEANGAYWGVVLNAGINRDQAFPALTAPDWDQVIDTGLNGFYNVLHPLTMPMIRLRQGGRVVTLASVSGLIGNRGQVNYSAAKGGLIAASKALALELASRKITVNCVAPGLIETDMVAQLPTEDMMKLIPMGRMGKPEEVAATVGFLFSDGAAYLTRQVISINGGLA
ncbi:3-ketoacyl-ACP reductase FabG2 [Leeia aquatica]|uniref:3-oxoacyl-ACP reductase FabG n=1 Tax=Leeia aquatica TaxID=2725557 RepID=A0A847S8K5_9NEIS|nr:3-ketoacyl-ACP reductase FabG2 [Leeia aquatica]NLR76093.1 3-oxoacyl-ACP reductase FabG [Leeia aquatica]